MSISNSHHLTPLTALEQLRNTTAAVGQAWAADPSPERFPERLRELHQAKFAMRAACDATQRLQELSDDLLTQPRR